jgi:hypothetical protein
VVVVVVAVQVEQVRSRGLPGWASFDSWLLEKLKADE